MFSFKLYCSALLVLAIVAGCVSHSSEPSTLLMEETDSGQTVAMTVEQELQISLGSNPSTGYSWEIESALDGILQQIGEPVFMPDTNLPGSGGTEVFTFRAIAAGELSLRLIYHRTWEENVPPIRTFELFITVTP
jgi:inhibitor of cysteine peptidase